MRYIILTGTLTGIGGSIIYSRNKKIFLEENGWHVDIYSTQHGNIMISEMEEYRKDIIEEIKFQPYYFSNKKLKKIIDKICGDIYVGEYEKIIVESHNINLSLWGEMIAERLKGKHIIFSLQEHYNNYGKQMMGYLDFKHKRKELAGISRKSLIHLFGDYKKLNYDENYHLKAVCTNVVENVENDIVNNISREDINIGCITRLEKNFVPGLIDEIIILAKKNTQKKVQLIIFGGSEKKEFEEMFYNKVKGIRNLNLIITGFLFPIPKKIFTLADVFIGVAGSSKISAREGIPTITVDVDDGKPIGVLGYDAKSSLYRDTEANLSISQLLEDVLLRRNFYLENIRLEDVKMPDFKNEFKNHLRFIEDSNDRRQYYSFNGYVLDKKSQIKKNIFKIMGLSGYKKASMILSKIRGI